MNLYVYVNLTCSRPIHNSTCFQHLSPHSSLLHNNIILSLSPSKDVNYAAVSHGGSVQLRHQAAPAESTVYADVRVNGQPTSYTPHLPNSQTKRPAPQPGPPPSIYSKVRKA